MTKSIILCIILSYKRFKCYKKQKDMGFVLLGIMRITMGFIGEVIMEKKIKYINLCKTEKTIPIFSQYWWMDAVCGEENWDIILVEENDEIIGSLPYYIEKCEEGYEIRKAVLTQNNGIWIRYSKNLKNEKKLSLEKKVMNKVIDEIEKLGVIRYRQYFHYTIENWLPFYWRNYNQTTRYTYVIEDTSNLDIIEKNFSGNIRNYIRKAEKQVSVVRDMKIEDFYEINRKTFSRQGCKIPYSFEVLKALHQGCSERNCSAIYKAVDKQGKIHSAVYFIWDETSVYYLLSGSEPEFRSSQSLTLLIYEGIKLAHNLNKKFDFEGSMKENIENFFRQFGAVQKSYHNIYKDFVVTSEDVNKTNK